MKWKICLAKKASSRRRSLRW